MAIVDALANLGDDINDEDLVMYTLSRLGDEYEQFVKNITSRDSDATFEALQTMLSDQEMRQVQKSVYVAMFAKMEVSIVPC